MVHLSAYQRSKNLDLKISVYLWYILHVFSIFYMYLVYFTCTWYILHVLGIFYGLLVYLMFIWYIFGTL
jgi:hypothetical protein